MPLLEGRGYQECVYGRELTCFRDTKKFLAPAAQLHLSSGEYGVVATTPKPLVASPAPSFFVSVAGLKKQCKQEIHIFKSSI